MRRPDNHNARVVPASRKNAGVRVTLLWAAETNAVAVLVRNHSTSDQFELVVEPEDNPIQTRRTMSTSVSPTPSTQHEREQLQRADATTASISERENREIETANASGNTPVVVIHGLWLLPSSWTNWAAR